MSREIKFRGKVITSFFYPPCINEGDWVYGYYVFNASFNAHQIMITRKEKNGKQYPVIIDVDPKTVGQYIGLEDKDKEEIYEGDILKFKDKSVTKNPYIEIVEWCKIYCGFEPFVNYDDYNGWHHQPENCKIIGNIHDNPELLEQKK